MSGLAFKPQTAALVPFALLGSNRRRLFLVWIAIVLVLAALSIAGLGGSGLLHYRDSLVAIRGRPFYAELTLAGRLPGEILPVLAELLGAGLATVGGWRLRNRPPELVMATGIFASLVATSYLNMQDLALLVVAGWILLRITRSRPVVALLLVSYAVVEFVNATGPLPLLVMEVGWFAWFLAGCPGLTTARNELLDGASAAPVRA